MIVDILYSIKSLRYTILCLELLNDGVTFFSGSTDYNINMWNGLNG